MSESEWTPEARAAYMKNVLSLLRTGGTWGMTMGVWLRVRNTNQFTLRPLRSSRHPDAEDICKGYAEDARRAGFEVELLPTEDLEA